MAAVLALAVLLGCLALPRYEAIEKGRGAYPVERLAEELDPWLLAEGFADAVVIEIDWVEGCRPGPRTVEGFDRLLRRYLPADRRIEIVLDDEIPFSAWDGNARNEAAVGRLLDEFAGTVARLEPGVEKRYVLFAPDYHGYFGISTSWTVERSGRTIPIDGVVVARGAHERNAKLWLSRDRLERCTLIHEFGHELGLVTNDRHERVHENHRGHCTGLTCLMAHPTPRVIARNAPKAIFNLLPDDYCRRCQEDIRRAQDWWRQRMRVDPEYEAVRRQARERRREEAALWGLLQAGRHEEILERIGELDSRSAGGEWADVEAHALTALGREVEALARLLPNLGADPQSVKYWRRRQQAGRLLVGFGRHDEAIALFDRGLLREADDHEFEQSTFVLLPAFRGAGSHAEAVALIEELLARGHDLAFERTGMIIELARSLRRAGRLDAADRKVSAGLRDRVQRERWLDEAHRLREAQGRVAEARELLSEGRDAEDRAFREASDPRRRWTRGWNSVRLLAESGALAAARERARELDSAGVPAGTRSATAMVVQAPAWIALGEDDRAAGLVAALGVDERGWQDPCGTEALDPLRSSPQHARLFDHCPARPRAGRPRHE